MANLAVTNQQYEPLQDADIVARLNALDEEDRQAFADSYAKQRETRQNDDPLSLKDYALLTLDALERAARSATQHETALQKIDEFLLHDNPTEDQKPLSVPELCFLERISGKCADFTPPAYFTHEYSMDYRVVLEKVFSFGYLRFSNVAESVQLADMPTLRRLAKDKGLKSGGKKADLIQRIMDVYSLEELSAYNLPKHYELTDAGQSLLKENDALILYHLMFGSRNWATDEEILTAQKAYPELDGNGILSMLLKKAIRESKTYSERLPLLRCLRQLCHDDTSRQILDRTIEEASIEWEKEFKRHQKQMEKDVADKIGMSVEELRKVHPYSEMDA